jgi:TonB family protein
MKPHFWLPLLLAISSQVALAQTAPTLQTFISAEYPAAAQAAGIEGEVLLRLTIEIDGSVSVVEVIKTAGFGLDEAAVVAAKRFIFQPALQNNTPSRAQILYRYRFSLQPKEKKANPTASPLDNGDTQALQRLVLVGEQAFYTNFIQGVLLEKGSRSAIESAQVFLLNDQQAIVQEQSLGEENTFLFSSLPPGTYTVKIVASGYQSLSSVETIGEAENLDLILRLMPSVEDGYGVVVRADSEDDAVTRRVLGKEELLMMPGTQGDALRALQNLPGVARPPGGAGLLIVRGSTPQDTQVFLNGMPIPFLFHLTGLNSVITTSLIESIDFQPGVYSARYGRGMGGVIEVRTKLESPDKTQATWDIGILDVSASVQTKVKGMGVAVAARRSDIDALLPLFLPEQAESFTVIPRYWDYQGGLGGKALGGSWQVLAFGARDTFTLNFEDPAEGDIFISSTTQFHRLQGFWEKKLDATLTKSVALSFGVTQTNEDAPPISTLDQTVLLGAARVDWAKRVTSGLGLRYGADLRLFSYEVRRLEPAEDFSTIESDFSANNPDAGLYTEAVWVPSEELTITPGLRLDYFGGSHSLTLEPRVQARWKVYKQTTISAGAGIFHEDPRPQDLNPIFGDPTLHPKESKQVTLGASRSFFDNKIQGDVSLYYKKLDNLISSIGSGATRAEVLTNDAQGRVKGAEFLLKYPPSGRFFGWLAYSLSKAERQRPDEPEYVPFFYDQRHVLTALGSFKLNASINLGARFRYSSGVPQTPVVVSVYDSDNNLYIPIEGERNSERLAAFHQLDLRADKTFRFKSWRMSGYLEILNIYNRQNAETTRYNFDYTQSQSLNGLPITPVLGLRGEL